MEVGYVVLELLNSLAYLTFNSILSSLDSLLSDACIIFQ